MSLQLNGIIKEYPEFRMRISFSVERGKLLTLLGPSGCGKTTTLHLIAGFISPDSGDILIDNESVLSHAPHERNIGVVFQDYALFPNMNVFGNIAFGLRMHGWEKTNIENRITELLDLVRLAGYGKRPVTELSGGEQQRVALARALAPGPKLLLLDEPLSALDAKLRKELRSEIRRIQQTVHLTTVYVTHDQEEALALSDCIAVMNRGCIEQTGSPFEIYNEPRTRFVADFMGMSNRVYGRIIGTENKKHHPVSLVETPEGRFTVCSAEHLKPGTDVVLVFRPEKCFLEKADGDENMISGAITACEYMGESVLVSVRTDHNTYAAKLSPENDGTPLLQIHTGTQIQLYIQSQHVLALPYSK
jgi:ABC-type Fe3+/spermidine/putrescine transport system ATPase subunit